MTREEAILILEEEAEFLYGGDEPYNKIAFDMAIEALSDDTVSREFYEDAVKANIGLVIENKELKEQIESADATQGEWIKHKGEWVELDFYPTKYECNQCHYCVDEGYDSIFCPNCGARMKADTIDVAHDIPEYCSWSQTYTNMVQSAMADTQTEERARLVAKETELAHIEAKLENAEKKLDSTKDCTKFLLWLLEEIMNEENWEMNAVADGEVIARKLTKLGLLEVKDGYYVRTSLTYGLQKEERESLIDKIKNWRKNHV